MRTTANRLRLRAGVFCLALTFAAGVGIAAAQAKVLAKVNGVEITDQDLEIARDDLAGNLPPQLQGAERDKALLDNLIVALVVAQKAEADKMASGPEFERKMAYMKEKILTELYLGKIAKEAATDANIQKTYDEVAKSQKPEPEVHARHILVESEDDAKKAAARVKGGEDFAKVATELSKDPGAKGGDLGWFTKDRMVPEFADAAFKLEPGQTVALLGATGSGKSTLAHLVPRFYDVTGGRITVDGVDVRAMDEGALRRAIGVAMQESVLFHGTIRDNIAYGRPDASEDEVIAAAKLAQAHDFIVQLPDGYNAMVEQRGVNLSGGQKQRLAIARALLVDPAVLVLDDSTSAVDVETEARIQAGLAQTRHGRTNLVVAQRISSVLGADRILVLEDGGIVASGTHAELLATSPIYQDIYRSQLEKGTVRHD